MLLPGTILLLTAGLLIYTAKDALRPTIAVRVAPVIPKPLDVSATVAQAQTGQPAAEGAVKQSGMGPVLVQAPGWIEPAPYATTVAALDEGVIREVLALEGQQVEAGSVVARMVDDDAKLQLRGAEATLAERRADVERARAAVATAEAQVRVDQAAVAELRDDLERKRDLVQRGAVGAAEFRQSEIRIGGLEARASTSERLTDEARAMLRQAEAAVAAAEVAQDQARLRLERMEIRSPIAGIVLERLVEPGTRMSKESRAGAAVESPMSGAVLRVYDPGQLQVRVDVPLADAAKVTVGTRARVTTEALPDTVFSGAVVRVVHTANIQKNTVQFKIKVDSPTPVLKPEMLTRVRLYPVSGAAISPANAAAEGGSLDPGMQLLVPKSALVSGGNGRFSSVWVIQRLGETPTAALREVQIEESSDEAYVTVSSGLQLTDRVVLDPPAQLSPGCRLRVLEDVAGVSAGGGER